jgi:hypothetical protein
MFNDILIQLVQCSTFCAALRVKYKRRRRQIPTAGLEFADITIYHMVCIVKSSENLGGVLGGEVVRKPA